MLKISWNLGLANLPNLVLEETLDFLPREECEFQFQDGMFWHIQDNGLVRYFAHNGSEENMGGFGGASFDIMYQGERKTIRGPWSSRASWLNTLLPAEQQVADIRLVNRDRYPTNCGILVSKLLEFWDVDAYLLRALSSEKEENGAITASLAPNCILKPDNMRYDPAHKYQIFAEPFNGA